VLLTLTFGPCLTWWFFRHERRARASCAGWLGTHPSTPIEMMMRQRVAELDFVTRHDIEHELHEVARDHVETGLLRVKDWPPRRNNARPTSSGGAMIGPYARSRCPRSKSAAGHH
jgi:hypothetical protein